MKLLIDNKLIESVIEDFEIDNPELSYNDMSPEEFRRRMMEKLKVGQPSPQATETPHE